MVYCTKCGTKNADAAVYCIQCGAKLEEVPKKETWDKRMEKWGEELGKHAEEWGEEVGKRAEEWGKDLGKRVENECFGLPNGGLIFGLLIGVVILLVGVTALLTGTELIRYFWSLFWALIIIVFGVLITAGAIYSLTRRR